MIMETNQDSIEEWMKDMTADTEDHKKDVVDQLPVLEDLQEGLVERAHVPNDGYKMDAFENDYGHSQEG